MTNDSRCASCPVDPALPCRGLQVRRFCALVDPANRLYDPRYAALLRLWATSPITDDRPPPAAVVAALAAVRACPYRSAPVSGCGCARCALAGGVEVAQSACVECVRRFGGA